MLNIDFTPWSRMVRSMPNKPALAFNRDLIQDLCLEAGRRMEDMSAELALVLPQDAGEIAARVQRLREAAQIILALAEAAHALTR